jgi:hypothetical protein
MKKLSVLLLAITGLVLGSSARGFELLETEHIAGEGVWVDPAISEFPRDQFRVTVWFEEQFLGDGEAYLRRTKEFTGIGRTALRKQVRETLNALSRRSQAAAGKELDALVDAKKITDLEYHWIVNGFTCRLNREHLAELKSVPGVRMVYFAGPPLRVRGVPAVARSEPYTRPGKEFVAEQYKSPWYVESLKAYKVWKEHDVTGKGILNVIHDGNFVLSPNILTNRYVNPNEHPNDRDDSGNGLVDDMHGYDFLLKRPSLTRNPIPKGGRYNSRVLHGHQCVAIICGRGTEQSPHRFGIAPESQWAGVLATQRIEAAVEWAIDQGADTYSMSFSRPDMREYRSHWRKLMEHGSFCGVHFVSGAGNFAVKGSPQFAPVPVQMRIPEDIPNVVFAAAGVQRDLSRTPFSSQGPVEWMTAHYKDGVVNKPEVSAFNFQLPLLLPSGKVVDKVASGNSFAGPMFCGVIALVLSANPDLHPWEVRQIVIETATDVGPDGFDFQTGHGVINAFAAVSKALDRKH